MLNELLLLTSLASYTSTWGFLPEDLEMWYHGHFSFVLFSVKLTVSEKKFINIIEKPSSELFIVNLHMLPVLQIYLIYEPFSKDQKRKKKT